MLRRAIPILWFSIVAASVPAVTGCALTAPTAAAPIPPILPGEGRIWVYRTYEPYADHGLPAVFANGGTIGWSQLGGVFYRDLPPGHYHVTVQSIGVDFNQSSNVDLAAGQQAYIRIVSLPSWVEGGFRRSYQRPTYYAWLIPPQVAAAEVAPLAFQGGG
jgi:hypothetical protein